MGPLWGEKLVAHRRFWAGKSVGLLLLSGLFLAACAGYRSYFVEPLDEADRQAMVRAAQKALEENRNGESTSWSNPETGHLGTVMPVRTFDADSGRPCREYQQTATVEGKTGMAYQTACREPDATWRIAGSANAAGVNQYWEPPGAAYPYYDYPYHYDPYHYSYYGHLGYGHRYGYGRYRWFW
jgi:surface antigen